MTVTFIVFLAFILGIFGCYGWRRGWKVALVMLVLIVGSLLLLSAAPERVTALFDYVNKAAALVTGGTKPLIDTAPSSLVVFMLIGAVILGFLLGLLRIFRAKPSFMGFLLGFISGYFFTAYMLAALVPQWAILPLPIKIQGLTPVPLSTAIASPSSQGLPGAIVDGLKTLCAAPCLPTAIVAGIFLFILLTVLASNRSSGKG